MSSIILLNFTYTLQLQEIKYQNNNSGNANECPAIIEV